MKYINKLEANSIIFLDVRADTLTKITFPTHLSQDLICINWIRLV